MSEQIEATASPIKDYQQIMRLHPEAERPRTRARLRLPRPTLPRFDMKRIRFPSRRSAVSAAIILVMAPAAFVVGHQAVLLTVLLLMALALTAVRFARRLPRLTDLTTVRPKALHGPRLPQRPLRAAADIEALRQSTRAMLQRLKQAAESLPASDDAAPPPRREPSLAHPADHR